MSEHEKSATLQLRLFADSGYEATSEHRISPNQWGRMNEILNEDAPPHISKGDPND